MLNKAELDALVERQQETQNGRIRAALEADVPTEVVVPGSEAVQFVDKTLYVEDKTGNSRRVDMVRTAHIPPSVVLGEE